MATVERSTRHAERAHAAKGTVPFLLTQKSGQSPENTWHEDAADESATRISALEDALRKRDETIRGLNHKLASIHASRTWQFAAACSLQFNRLLPLGSFRRKLLGRSARAH